MNTIFAPGMAIWPTENAKCLMPGGSPGVMAIWPPENGRGGSPGGECSNFRIDCYISYSKNCNLYKTQQNDMYFGRSNRESSTNDKKKRRAL